MKLKIKLECIYNGHSIKKNGSVDLSFKVSYSQLIDVMKLLQLLSCNITLKAKLLRTDESFNLGVFYLNSLNVDREGESTLKFNSEIDNVELNNLSMLAEKNVIIFLLCLGEVEGNEDDEE